MAKKNLSTTTSADDSGMAIVLTAEAIAIGQDTLTSVDATSNLTGNENVTKAKGKVTAISMADSPEDGTEFAITDIGVDFSGADKIHIKSGERSGERDGISYEISVLDFKAIDHTNKDGETKVKIQDKSPEFGHHWQDSVDFVIQLDGNIATATFDAQASADNSLVVVDAAVLAIEDELSLSAVTIISAVG
jgi:hypothetical protein